jgi:hypothetical protein
VAVLALAIVSLLLLLLVFWVWSRTRRLARRLDSLTRGQDDEDLSGVLDAHLDKVFAVSNEVDDLTVRTAVAESNLRHSFQRIGLIRFNPFEDTGGNQSFALALLDANGDGLVLSSLHSRGGTRVYAKSVNGGRAETALSEEESEAVRQAMAGTGTRTTGAA